MSKIKPKQATAKQIFSGFDGIRCASSQKESAAADIRNFRIRCDGTLEKRGGWEPVCSFSATIRGFWQGTLEGVNTTFVVAGTTVYRLTDDSEPRQVGTVGTAATRISFFRLAGELYLLDGSTLRIYLPLPDTFREVIPYAPLCGENWHPEHYGNAKEPINLLTDRLRIHYLNSTSTTKFHLPYYAKAVDKVLLDNVAVQEYTLSALGDSVEIPAAASASSVEIAMRMEYTHEMTEDLLSCTESFVFEDDGTDTVFLFGSKKGYPIFISTPVLNHMESYCKVFYPMTDPIYVTPGSVRYFGSAAHPVRAMCRHFRRVLAFNSEGIFALEQDKGSDQWEGHVALTGLGCNSRHGVLPYPNGFVLLDKTGLYHLKSIITQPDRFEATRINCPLCEGLDELSLSRSELHYNIHQDELWLRNPNDAQGLVWVRNNRTEQWYCFDNIPARDFFWDDLGGGFLYQGKLCRFRENLHTDNGLPFEAYYQSEYFTFDSPETVKRALRACLCGTSGGNTAYLTLQTEQETRFLSLVGKDDAPIECFDRRVPIGRFRFLRFRISVTGNEASRFYSLSLYTKA
ncbi:MAG: hypothetical protein IKB75_01625 [Clostridia bacterium]|nr:hypothetical protein [Clostridia bacterium]